MGDNYIIVAKDVTLDMDDFLKEVNAKIDEGYITCGGVALREDSLSHRDYCYQAMKKGRRYTYGDKRVR